MFSDTTRPQAFDVLAALGLLTRLPITVDGVRATARGAAAAWAWPLAGALVGLIGGLAGAAALGLGLPAGLAAALTLATQALVTGAMHEDGLADSADGLWGGWDRARRLAIMKDSHIGTYGVLALVLSLIARWSALMALLPLPGALAILVAVGGLSRAPMAVLMAWLPNARDGGLSHSVGRPEAATAALASVVAFGLAFGLLGAVALPAALLIAGATLAFGAYARRRIGGQTGDILGAAQQLAEVLMLSLLAARLAA
jgi:adenosylcobinamide-GDP ribazoletransferase